MEREDLRSGEADLRQNPNTSPVITQRMLADYRRLKSMRNHHDQLRKQLLQLVEAGATVEDGRLDVDVRVTTQQRLTVAALVELLGPDVVEELRDSVEPSVFRTLVITERQTEAHRRPPRRRDIRGHGFL